jgi:hypothetical protein
MNTHGLGEGVAIFISELWLYHHKLSSAFGIKKPEQARARTSATRERGGSGCPPFGFGTFQQFNGLFQGVTKAPS